MPGYPQNDNRQRIIDVMPGTQKEIAERLNLSLSVVCRWLIDICETKEAHIYKMTDRESGNGPQVAHYDVGVKPDGLRLRKSRRDTSPTALNKKYIKKLKTDGRYEDYKEKRRAIYQARKAKPKVDPLNALFGRF